MSKTKRIYIMRHGQAEGYHGAGDSKRNLTQAGIEEVVSTATLFKDKGISLDAVFVSPYVRAQQTAQAFFSVVGTDGIERIDSADITPDGDVLQVGAWLSSTPYDSVLLITHQPFASFLADFLSDEPLPVGFAMPTAALVALEGEVLAGACCQYNWQLLPS
ncbi:phosphohistidine phosphatase SixA [Marinomonas sp. C2222]|uniref:Phosphohistidine phosphatase SixA n=1 Tax=Marinomonas sargassi TaxID=2984494 RepID=A0ABT2YS56_9GAMM|nr:phosphohistidine phosphatase SixA [Marinomonas sargassi]MCV2402711.1 phosphohistidine phosphatase SixA [Marinomonas sargassi]